MEPPLPADPLSPPRWFPDHREKGDVKLLDEGGAIGMIASRSFFPISEPNLWAGNPYPLIPESFLPLDLYPRLTRILNAHLGKPPPLHRTVHGSTSRPPAGEGYMNVLP